MPIRDIREYREALDRITNSTVHPCAEDYDLLCGALTELTAGNCEVRPKEEVPMCNVGYGPHCRDCEQAPSCDVKPGRTLTVTIPDQIHPSLNKLNTMHWAARNRIKKEWAEDIFWRVRAARWRGPAMKRARVRIEYFCGDKRRRDKDNENPKFIMDGLVQAGVLADDNSRAVDLDWTLHAEGPRRTVIQIVEMEGGEAA